MSQSYLSGIVRCEERVGCPRVVRPAGPADAMHVVLRVVGIVVIDDELHVFHVCMELVLVFANAADERTGGHATLEGDALSWEGYGFRSIFRALNGRQWSNECHKRVTGPRASPSRRPINIFTSCP